MTTAVLEAARKTRSKKQEKLEALLVSATAEARALNADESGKFEALSADIGNLDKQIEMLEKEAKRAAKAAAAAASSAPAAEERAADKPAEPAPAAVRSEPMTYGPDGANSYYRDLALMSAVKVDGNYSGRAAEAAERMKRHAKEVDVETRSMSAAERRTFEANLARYNGTYEQRVNPNNLLGQGGEFVPPLWLVGQFAPYKRPTRVAANRCVNMPLPGGIDVINIPKITLGSLTGVQQAQGGAVASRDVTTATVAAPVRTIAGQVDISLQLLEQSPIAMDGVLFADLQRDYDLQLDTQLLVGNGAPSTTGSNGQHLGVFAVQSTTVAANSLNSLFASQIPASSTVFFDGSTSASQYRAVINGVNQIETLYFDAPSAIWVHPRRANSWAYAADTTTGRPLFTPAKYGQYNQVGTNEGNPIPQGVAGELYGLPVVKNANIPTTCNGFTGNALNLTGGTQDAIAILDESQLWLWEGSVKTRALPEILSGTLQIRFQLYAYSAFMPHRFPTAISVLSGAGLAAPAF